PHPLGVTAADRRFDKDGDRGVASLFARHRPHCCALVTPASLAVNTRIKSHTERLCQASPLQRTIMVRSNATAMSCCWCRLLRSRLMAASCWSSPPEFEAEPAIGPIPHFERAGL